MFINIEYIYCYCFKGSAIVDFYLFYEGRQIRTLVRICQYRVSDTQVTVNARGPLFFNCIFNISQ